MSTFWLADKEARVLGPVGIDVIRDLAVRGKLMEVRAVSRDGRNFVPVREVPEIVAVLAPPKGDDIAQAQNAATQQIRDWLAAVRDRPTHEIFRVPDTSSREAWRAAFFALVHRYVPSRLPPEATPELRLACEDAFLFLADRMAEVEKRFKGQSVAPTVRAAQMPTTMSVKYWGGIVHVTVSLASGDATPLVGDPECDWKSDSIFVPTTERMTPGGLAEVRLRFEGHVREISSSGRIVAVRPAPHAGIGIKLLDLEEEQRSLIRMWVQRLSR